MTIGELMMQKAETNEEKEYYKNSLFSLLKKDAANGNPTAQYELGKSYYEQKDFDDAEKCWEKAARQGHQTAKAKLEKLYKNELRDKYNSSGPVPMSASRATRGGNAPSGSWSKWN